MSRERKEVPQVPKPSSSIWDVVQVAHEKLKANGLPSPGDPIVPIYNFIEQVLYGSDADLVATDSKEWPKDE